MGRGPGVRGLTRVVEVVGCGHAPALNVPDQIDLIAAFIDEHERAPSVRPVQRATASRP